MKRIAILLIILVLAFKLTACTKSDASDKISGITASGNATVKTTASGTSVTGSAATETIPAETTPAVNDIFSIQYDLGNVANIFTDMPQEARAGDIVEMKTVVLYDADIHVYANGEEIGKTHYDSDYWGYSFTMPDKDVDITARFYTKDEIWGTGSDLAALKERYPEYFDLSAFKGLEVYVWQMAPDSYSFGLMPGTNREKTLQELWDMKGASAGEMRIILSTYDVDEADISIIPWQNPISSYLGDYWIREKDEEPESVEKRRQEYIDCIRKMLFATGEDT